MSFNNLCGLRGFVTLQFTYTCENTCENMTQTYKW